MFNKTIYRDYQQLLAGDLSNVQNEVQDGLDSLVKDAITSNSVYTGFTLTKVSATEIGIAAGRLRVDGKSYRMEDPQIIDLVGYAPISTRKKIAVCVSYSEVDTEEAPRNFLTDVTSRTYEPRTVAMVRARLANVTVYAGVESSDPAMPSIPVGSTLVGTVIYGTTGIETGGIEMYEPNRLRSVKVVDDDVTLLEAFRAVAEMRIATLASDVSALAILAAQKADQSMLLRLAEETARLREKLDEPDSGTVGGRDNFLDTTESDTVASGYDARVEEGVTFAAAASTTTDVTLSTPNDPKVSQSGGVMLPAFAFSRRVSVTGQVDQVNVSQYTITNRDFVKIKRARYRLRFGYPFYFRTPFQYWLAGRYLPAKTIFYRTGDNLTYWAALSYDDQIAVSFKRKKWAWIDKYKTTYWKPIQTTDTVNGAHVAQTFLNAQDGWLARIGVYFTQLAATGDLRLILCEATDAGTPDRTKTLFNVTVTRGSIATGWNDITVPYSYLEKGKRYAICILTAAAHYVGLANGGNYPGGTFFQSVDDAYYQGVLNRDMMFRLDYAQFSQNRIELDLAPLELSGGMNAIDVLGQITVPDGCTLQFEARKVAQTAWNPIGEGAEEWLTGLPTQLAFRAVFTGTADIMPAIDLNDTKVVVWRPKLSFKHISTARTPGFSANTVYVKLGLEGFDPAHHTVVAKIDRSGTIETYDALVTTTVDGPNDTSALEKLYTFNLGASASSYNVVIEATTDSADRPFAVTYRTDSAAT